MINDLRFELSFKSISQLENKLNFCVSNNIKKINIPCKGVIKKDFLNETVKYIGENFKNLDVIYHYSLYHQFTKNRENSYLELLNFIEKCKYYKNNEILLVSGSNKKKNFEVLDVLKDFKNEKNLNINIGVAYNPYLKNHYNICGERERIKMKFSSRLTKSIWLQFGTDIKLLETEINFLKESIINNSNDSKDRSVRIFGSLLVPSRGFISRFKFRPWKEVFISEKYLNSIDNFYAFTKDLIAIYLDNNICPIIETECSSLNKLHDIHSLMKKITT